MAAGTAMADIPQTISFETPGGITMSTILLSPIPVTQDNLDVVIQAGWITQEDACAGVEAGTVSACG